MQSFVGITYRLKVGPDNAAVAAEWLSQADELRQRVAIIDLDAHHGNGTQEIFYGFRQIYYTSLHAEGAFPHFSGGTAETGSGAGKGYTRNYPMPIGTGEEAYLETLEDALRFVGHFDPRWLVISLGVDTYEKDPFQLLCALCWTCEGIPSR